MSSFSASNEQHVTNAASEETVPIDLALSPAISSTAVPYEHNHSDNSVGRGVIDDPVHAVSWEGPDDPENPKNWSFKRKWLAVGIVSLYTLMSATASSIIAPAESQIGKDLNVSNDFLVTLVFAIFLLGYVVGPLVLAPLSELYGRAMILRLSNLWFTAFLIGCGFSQTVAQLLVFRFLAGVGACAPQTVGGGVLSDCFRAEQRGKAVALYSLAPVLGPSLGPLVGGFITVGLSWRWCFWILTCVGAAIQVSLWFGLQETSATRLLHLKAKNLEKENPGMHYKSEQELDNRGTAYLIEHAMIRPFKLLGTQIVVQYLALYMALSYGIIFLMLSTFPTLWSDQYGESIEIGGLNYISIALGMSAGAQLSGVFLDRTYRQLKAKSGSEKGRPEYRVPIIWVSTLCISSGLLIYGWTAAYRVQWIVPNIGAFIFALGAMITMTALQSYTIDAYPRYAASAIGVTAIARSMTGFGFPLFAKPMYASLGYGWGNSVLALGAFVIGLPGALVLWFYGEELRRRSPYAAGD